MSAIVKYYFALDMVPGGVSPVIHLSKYAEAYELVFLLYSRTGELTIPSNGKAIIRGTKSDGKVFSANATLSGNTVTVTGDKQMTAAEGKNTFEIVLSDSSGKELGSSNFTIQVEAASMDYGTTSDSQLLEISNVTATAAELTQASTNIQESVRTFEAMLATLEPDKTLSKDGEAADAKATGDRLIAVETTAQTTADTVGSIVDATLAVSGKAADSATVGSELSNLKSEIGLKSLEYTKGYYIDVSGATADISNPASSVNWAYAIDECEGGDVYNVIAYGSSAGRMWAFLDDDGTVLYRPPTTINVSREFYTVQAPSGAKWFVSNTKYTEIEGICIKGNLDLSNAFVPLQHGGKIIEPNTNILSLEAGSYFCILAGTPATLENCPTTDTFRLTIYKRGAYNNQDYLGAIIIDASKQIWINAKGANGWTGWLSIVNKKILEGALNEALNELTAPIPSTFSRAEFVRGSLADDGTQRYAISAIITRDYIPEHVYGFRVTSGNYKVALGIWTKADGTFRRSYWYTPDTPVAAYDCAYVFDHSLYNYKLYILRTDEAALTNPSEAVSSIMVAVDAKKIIDSYHTMIGEHINLGEATSRLRSEIGLKSLEYTKGYYIDVSGATADISNPASSVNWAYAIDECEGGDVYNVIAYGSSAGRMWAFLDDDGTVLYRPPTTINVSREFYTVQAPSGAKWFVSNTKYTEIEGICIKGNLDLSNAFVPLQHGGKIIEPNTNILSLEAGSYFCILAGTPATLENCPTTDTFRLTIYKRGAYNNQDYLGAIIIDASKQIWINAKGANGWTGWLSIVNKKILEGALNEALNELTAPIPSTFSRAEFVRGSLADDGTQRYAISAIITRDYIPEHVYGFRVTSGNYKVALGIWTKADGTFRRSYWYTPDTPVAAYDCAYVFDHSLYNYKLYILRTDEAALTNPSEAVSSIMVAVDAKKIIDSYHTMIGEHINLGEATSRLSNRVFDIMRNNYNVDYANAMFPISLNSVYGDNQNVHPKVLYFADGFGGHKFWMAYTPYPFGSTPYENPCIAFSDDGYEWENIEGNPIDEPGENDSGYMSDTHLVLRDGVLECWYRLADDVNMQEIIFRKTSSDGIHWSDRETLHTSADGSISTCLSPAIIWDGEKYHIWTVYWGSRSYIEYWESMTGRDWEKIRDIDLNYTDTSDGTKYNVWHLDVVKDSEKYILLTMCKYSHRIPPWSLFIATSEDNITYETPYIVMRGNPSSWDQMMYRSTLVKVETEYRLYYSAMDTHYVHGIGLTVSNTLDSFLPVLSKDVNEHLSY